MDLTEIRKLVRLMLRADLSELEIDDSKKGCRVHLKRSVGSAGAAGAPAPVVQFMPPAGAPAPQAAAGSLGLDPAGGEAALAPGTETFPSPMVGTFYRSPSPDSDPFIDVGESYTEDKVLCIIEAMKVMNEIKAEGKGQVLEVLVENGEPIEFGQPLFLIKKG